MAEKKRELIDTGTEKRYVRRESDGTFGADQVDVGKSAAADQRHDATTDAKEGHGDEGDRAKS